MLRFFETSTSNLLMLKRRQAWAITSRCRSWEPNAFSESGYFRAKIAQEKLIKRSSIEYSIVHATQFFEFIKRIADDATDGNTVRVAPVLIPTHGG